MLKFYFLFLIALGMGFPVFAVEVGKTDEAQKAFTELNQIFQAYGAGNTALIEDKIIPSMIGLQKMLNDIGTEANRCKQLNIFLKDTQIQAAPDLVVIQTNWEKRCLQIPGFTQQFYSGHSTFLMQKASSGWTLSGISGQSPFNISTSAR